MSRCLGVALVALLSLTASADARPKLVVIDDPTAEVGPLTPQGLVPYNTIFLNKCTGGCLIKVGPSSSLTDSWQVGSQRTLTAWPYDDATWQKVVSCVKDTFEPFAVQITDVDPGTTASHFEIMIAGSPQDVGMAANVGGVAPGNSGCSGYINNGLVFDFAKVWGNGTTCNAACVEDICSTAAQEIGHAWNRMDHVVEAKDPMTYFPYAGRRYFQNAAVQCGSDCSGGTGPGGVPCSGTNNQVHQCYCGSATQNSYSIITALFGAGTLTPPSVTINRPKANATVDAGFVIDAMAMDNSGTVTKVDIAVDGQIVKTLTTGPYVLSAPATLTAGPHKIEVTAYDPHGTPGKGTVDVMIGPPCKESSDCAEETNVCVGGRCVPGSGVDGGLGTTCVTNDDCSSGKCASDGTKLYCVEQCVVGDCPSGFGCQETGNNQGVCWPGFDDGTGGGCGCQSDRGTPLGMLVLLGWLVLLCRKRTRS